MKHFLALVLVLFLGLNLTAKDNYTLAFYNVENLFDTLPSPNYADQDFTPTGKYKWTSDKYRAKIENISYAIDQISADIIGLCEIENESVIRDLVINLKTDYNYLVLSNGDRRGINMALLYKGDKFTPTLSRKLASGTKRSFYLIQGRLDKSPINIIIVHLASNYNSEKFRALNLLALNKYAQELSGEQTIIMGDFNSSPTDKIFRDNMPKDYLNPFREFALKSMGSCAYKGVWMMYDNILLSKSFATDSPLKFKAKGILIQEELLDKDSGFPRRCFAQGRYQNGYSDHLPVWVIVER
ncbi:MAG: endonuclease/exonuclease/phosphatase family protein [Rikenellaceae bacterium]